MTKKCKRCGKNILRHFEYCWQCNQIIQARARERFEAEMKLIDSEPSEVADPCVMCGKEFGTYLRKDGKYYCTQCWMVWNS